MASEPILQSQDEPKIAIIGVGPVGGILAAHLALADNYVVICDIQKSHLDAIRTSGLSITGFLEMTARCDRVACSISNLASFPTVDTIIIATKASILPRIIPEIKKIARPGMRFISCQNGLNNEEFLAETFGPDNVLRIIVNWAGRQIGDGRIEMSFFNPPNYLGAMTPHREPLARRLVEMMTEAGLDTRFTANIKRYEWEKVILSAGLNAMCALARKPMKDMMNLRQTKLLAEELMREGVQVAEASGITFDEGFFQYAIQYLNQAGYHRTSMYQDILRRTPSEIDWLNGRIVEQGHALGIQTPHNFSITALIKGLEMKSEAPGKY